MELGSLFPWLLAAHVLLAISLFMPSFLLPFTFRFRRHGYAESPETESGRIVHALLWLQSHGTVIIGAGVALTGLGMVAVLGTQLLSQPWLLVALSIYAANLAAAFFIQRPGVRRLLRLPSGSSPEEQDRWRALARRQRYVSYLMAAAIGIIGFLMMSKPSLW
jgi:hypothetical protein